MAGWLKRLIGGASSAPAPAPAPESATAPHTPAKAFSATATQTVAVAQPGLGARRPLVSAGGEVAGFEFMLADSLQARLQSRPDAVVQAAHAMALLASMQPTLASGRIALATLPAALLTRPAVLEQLQQLPAGAMLALAEPPTDPAELRAVLDALRLRGVRVGVADSAALPAVQADFVVLPFAAPGGDSAQGSADSLAGLLTAAQRWKDIATDITLVVTDVDHIDDIERALAAGVTLVAGRIGKAHAAREKRPMNAGLQRIVQMLNNLVNDQHTTRLAEDLRADVALSYRLLRYVNSPALGLSRGVDSVDQAVIVLGRSELYRWLSVLLLTAADGRKASRALQEISLARARFLESLARERGVDAPDALFTVGMLSLLDAMLQVPLADAVGPLRLGDAARDALLTRSGPWSDYLALATDLENRDLPAAAARAEAFGGLPHVLELSDESWRWASAVYREVRAG